MAITNTKVTFLETISSELANLPIVKGQLIYTTDTNKIYHTTIEGVRQAIATEVSVVPYLISNPKENHLYVILSGVNRGIHIYNNGNWINLTEAAPMTAAQIIAALGYEPLAGIAIGNVTSAATAQVIAETSNGITVLDFTLPIGPEGPQGPAGKGFSISKVYSSVQEMMDDWANPAVSIGDFVLVSTQDIQDEDNAKLFVKTVDGFGFITDLSGATGIAGEGATITIGTVKYGANASVTNTGSETHAIFNFELPRGQQGTVWYAGSRITGVSTIGTIFPGSGISNALIGDWYLNNNYGYIYQCTVGGGAGIAEWIYFGKLVTYIYWNDIYGKPETFPPSEHTHNINDIEGIDGGNFVTLNTDQTITGLKIFSTLPRSSVAPTLNTQLVNKLYVDNLVASGGGGGGGNGIILYTGTKEDPVLVYELPLGFCGLIGEIQSTSAGLIHTIYAEQYGTISRFIDEKAGTIITYFSYFELDEWITIQFTDRSVIETSSSRFLTTNTAQFITGLKTFETLPQSYVTPTSNYQLVNKLYVDSLSGGGDMLKSVYDTNNNSVVDRAEKGGIGSLVSLTTGVYNSAWGNSALAATTTGRYNTAVGENTLSKNTSGYYNTAVGSDALSSNTAGQFSTAIGYNALSLSTGSNNTSVGYHSMSSNTSGHTNLAIGGKALQLNTTGYYNTAVGHEALNSNTEGYTNTAIGYQSLINNTTGYQNVAIGNNALNNNIASNQNIAIGGNALRSNTASFNVAIGHDALRSNTTATGNIAIGFQALYTSTTPSGNTAIGYSALYNDTTGDSNNAIGNSALYWNTTGSSNTAMGYGSLNGNSYGNYNTAIGNMSGAVLSNGSTSNSYSTYSTFIGSNTKTGATQGLTNMIVIGYNAEASASNQITLGNTAITSLRCNVTAISALSDTRMKEDIKAADLQMCLDAVLNLPVHRYKYKDFTGTHLDQHVTGWLANDVELVFPKAVQSADEYFTELDDKGNPVMETIIEEVFDEEGNITEKERIIEKKFLMKDVKNITMSEVSPTLWGAVQRLYQLIEDQQEEIRILKEKVGE